MQPCISQIPTMVLECHRLISCQQPHDDVKALLEELTRLGLREPDHDAVRRQRAWSGTEHRAPAGQVIEQHDAFRDPQRIVVGEADDARAKLDVTRALGRNRDHDFGRRADLRTGGMVLTKPRFIVTEAVEPSDQIQIVL